MEKFKNTLANFIFNNNINLNDSVFDYLKNYKNRDPIEIKNKDGDRFTFCIKDNLMILINKDNEFQFYRIPVTDSDISEFVNSHDSFENIWRESMDLLLYITRNIANPDCKPEKIKSTLEDKGYTNDDTLMIITICMDCLQDIVTNKEFPTRNVIIPILSLILLSIAECCK